MPLPGLSHVTDFMLRLLLCAAVSARQTNWKPVGLFATVSCSRPDQGKFLGEPYLGADNPVPLRVVPDSRKGAPSGRAGRRCEGRNQVDSLSVDTQLVGELQPRGNFLQRE